jgi:hypothetical protein
MANPKKLITFSERTLEMSTLIQRKLGLLSTSQVVARGIEELFKEYSKYGKELGTDLSTDNDIERQAERKVKQKLAQEKATQDAKEAPKIKICEVDLGGEIITREDGLKMCAWTNYGKTEEEDRKQKVLIHQCGDYLLGNLFQPNKEVVLKARPELRKKFKNNEKNI